MGGAHGQSGQMWKISGFDPRTVHPVAQSLYSLRYPAHNRLYVSTYSNSFLRRSLVPSLALKSRAQFCNSSLSRWLCFCIANALAFFYSATSAMERFCRPTPNSISCQGADKSFAGTERAQAEKHVRRRARFQQHRDASCHQFLFPARQGAEGN